MKIVRWFVSRDYTNATELTVTAADFYDEDDAREYYRWKKRDENAYRKKYGRDPAYVWKLGKRTETWDDERRIRYEYEWLEG